MLVKNIFCGIERDIRQVEDYLQYSLEGASTRLQKSFLDLLTAGGKRIRPAFTILAARYGKDYDCSVIPLAAALELVHMASLVHDDVIDNSELRRGKPTIRALYGNNNSLHLGNYLFARALSIMGSYSNPQINLLLARASIEMCRGELAQLSSVFHYKQDIKDYLFRIKRKTALLITHSCQAGAMAAGAETHVVTALGKYGYYVGMAYQITDDVLDYIANEETLGKPVGSDLQQGIVTLPLIYAVKYGEPAIRQRLLGILAIGTLKEGDILKVIELVNKTEAISFSLNLANRYIEKGIEVLEDLPNNDTTNSFRHIARFIHYRQT